MSRRGKIARLPGDIREELNVRLENGEQGGRLLEWLNALPEVMKVLQEEFEGQPVSDANLTHWRYGGFLDWQAWQKAESMVEQWEVGSPMSKVHPPSSDYGATSSPKPEDGTGSPTSNVQGPKSEKFSEALMERLMVHYVAALEDTIGEPAEPRKRVKRLGQSLREVMRLRRYELARERAALERERLELQRAKAKLNNQAVPESKEKPTLSHQEKAEVIKQMLRDL